MPVFIIDVRYRSVMVWCGFSIDAVVTFIMECMFVCSSIVAAAHKKNRARQQKRRTKTARRSRMR